MFDLIEMHQLKGIRRGKKRKKENTISNFLKLKSKEKIFQCKLF